MLAQESIYTNTDKGLQWILAADSSLKEYQSAIAIIWTSGVSYKRSEPPLVASVYNKYNPKAVYASRTFNKDQFEEAKLWAEVVANNQGGV